MVSVIRQLCGVVLNAFLYAYTTNISNKPQKQHNNTTETQAQTEITENQVGRYMKSSNNATITTFALRCTENTRQINTANDLYSNKKKWLPQC